MSCDFLFDMATFRVDINMKDEVSIFTAVFSDRTILLPNHRRADRNEFPLFLRWKICSRIRIQKLFVVVL
jgi:hypothetical protein